MGHKSTWATDAKPPAPTLLASQCLATLSTIKRKENRRKLSQLVENMDELERGNKQHQYNVEVNSLVRVNTALDTLEPSRRRLLGRMSTDVAKSEASAIASIPVSIASGDGLSTTNSSYSRSVIHLSVSGGASTITYLYDNLF